MVLGPLMERALRQSLEISGGDASIFFTRPISAAALAIAAAFAVTSLLQVARSVKSQDVQV
jgi:putative tricarboxylic transport membrane protein